jgi:hypothetical protein
MRFAEGWRVRYAAAVAEADAARARTDTAAREAAAARTRVAQLQAEADAAYQSGALELGARLSAEAVRQAAPNC